MSIFNLLYSLDTGPDERVQLQYEYDVLHNALKKTEEACLEVEKAILHLKEDNRRLMQIIQSKQERH